MSGVPDYEQEVGGIQIVIRFMSAGFGASLLETLLYGAHFILFLVALYLLCPRKGSWNIIVLIIISSMFILATTDVALSWRYLIVDLPAIIRGSHSTENIHPRLSLKNYLFVSSNRQPSYISVLRNLGKKVDHCHYSFLSPPWRYHLGISQSGNSYSILVRRQVHVSFPMERVRVQYHNDCPHRWTHMVHKPQILHNDRPPGLSKVK